MNHTRRLSTIGFLTLIGWLGCIVSMGFGQGFLVPEHDIEGHRHRMPRPWRPLPEQSYALRELTIDASVKQQVATTQVTQVFQNTGSTQMEVSFVFPLPYDGAVDRLTFMVDGKEYDAKLLPADEARRVYEGYVRRFQDPALLEWVGTGMFKTSVFPVPPGASRTVQLRYSQLLKQDQKLVDYLFPMSTAQYTSKPIEKLSLRVAIESTDAIKNIYSPTHQVDIRRDDDRHVVVQHSATNIVPSSDFRLVYDSAPGKVTASLLTSWPEGEDQGYFIMLAAPEITSGDAKPVRKTVIFVVDQSGSMSGDKIEQAREAAKFVVNNLRNDDLFNVVSYENDVRVMSTELERFDDASRSKAIGFVNGITSGGGTNIDGALQAATKLIVDGNTPSYVVFLTDGLPTVGQVNELKIAENMRQNNVHRSRLISFGVGYDVNSRLLDRLARENRGQSEYVRPNENIEVAVSRLFQKLSAPVLTDMKLGYQFENAQVESGEPINRVYPKDVQDLFAGSQLVLVGRYRTAGPAVIKLTGNVGSKSESLEFPVNFASKGTVDQYSFVRQIWAIRRIGEIIDLIDLNGKNDELIKELVALSTKHGIVTPYTSFLADENSPVRQLTDYHGNFQNAQGELGRLESTTGGDALAQRARKQSMKSADLAGNSFSNRGGAMPASGEGGNFGGGGGQLTTGITGGIDLSESLDGQSNAPSQGIRKAGNSTIYKRGQTLVADNAVDVDIEKDKSSIVNINRYSKEYFELVKDNSVVDNQIFAQQGVDEELVVRLRGKVYRIK